MVPAGGQEEFPVEMGAHEAFLASGNKATRQPAPGKVRARRRRNRRVVSTLTATQPKSWHFHGFAHTTTRYTTWQVRPAAPVSDGQGQSIKKILVALRSEMPAVGNQWLSRWRLFCCGLRVKCDCWDSHLLCYLRHFPASESADHEPETEMSGGHEGPRPEPANGLHQPVQQGRPPAVLD